MELELGFGGHMREIKMMICLVWMQSVVAQLFKILKALMKELHLLFERPSRHLAQICGLQSGQHRYQPIVVFLQRAVELEQTERHLLDVAVTLSLHVLHPVVRRVELFHLLRSVVVGAAGLSVHLVHQRSNGLDAVDVTVDVRL